MNENENPFIVETQITTQMLDEQEANIYAGNTMAQTVMSFDGEMYIPDSTIIAYMLIKMKNRIELLEATVANLETAIQQGP